MDTLNSFQFMHYQSIKPLWFTCCPLRRSFILHPNHFTLKFIARLYSQPLPIFLQSHVRFIKHIKNFGENKVFSYIIPLTVTNELVFGILELLFQFNLILRIVDIWHSFFSFHLYGVSSPTRSCSIPFDR